MAYHIPRSAFRYMDDATFRSGPSVAPAYGTSRSKDQRIPHSVYSPAQQRGEYSRAGHTAYEMAYERGTPYESDMYPHSRSQRHFAGDMIQRTNREASLSNTSQYRLSQQTLIHPILCADGCYPSGFSTPRPMEDLYAMSVHQIEQILAEYGLPAGSTRFSNEVYGRESSRARKLANLAMLLEFLGAGQLAEGVRQRVEGRRGGGMMLGNRNEF